MFGANDVHPDAAAGDGRHMVRRREPGDEEQIDHVSFGHPCRLFRCHGGELDRLRSDGFQLDPRAVIGHLDRDLARPRGRPGRTTPSAGLPAATRSSGSSMPWSTALRTMCVNGSLMRLDDRTMQLGVIADGLDPGTLVQRDGEVARRLWEGAPRRVGSAADLVFITLS